MLGKVMKPLFKLRTVIAIIKVILTAVDGPD